MVDKLRDDPFWRARIINFVADALHDYNRLTPVSNFEKKILERCDSLKEIDRQVDGGLVNLLKFAETFIPPPTALRVLMYWFDKGKFNTGYEIVYLAAKNEMVLTEEEISELFRDIQREPDLDVGWLMTILDAGESVAVENKIEPKISSLNLPSDFR